MAAATPAPPYPVVGVLTLSGGVDTITVDANATQVDMAIRNAGNTADGTDALIAFGSATPAAYFPASGYKTLWKATKKRAGSLVINITGTSGEKVHYIVSDTE